MNEPYICNCCGEETECMSADCDFCFVTCRSRCRKVSVTEVETDE